jgi:cardiolipin synthase
MPSNLSPKPYQWLNGGDEIFPALFAAMNAALKTIRLEIYIFADDALGRSVRQTLIDACARGVRVQLLLDASGSLTLTKAFWEPFLAAGGEMRWFNPDLLRSLGSRDHRKLLVCDESTAFIGGFNVATHYLGDGIKSGWYDFGLKVVSPLAVQLAAAFDEMFTQAKMPQLRFKRLRRSPLKRAVNTDEGRLLLSGLGRGVNPFTRSLRHDLAGAAIVLIIVPYFLPTWRLRRDLIRIARRGGSVQIIVPAKSDVLISLLAGQSLYRRFLRAGLEIFEFQPQILHAKLILVDDSVYVGSSNLDPRSLYINYELMLRITNETAVAEARELFAKTLALSKKLDLETWRAGRTWWRRLKQRWAYFVLVRADPFLARYLRRRKH